MASHCSTLVPKEEALRGLLDRELEREKVESPACWTGSRGGSSPQLQPQNFSPRANDGGKVVGRQVM